LASEIHGFFSLQVAATINGLALGLPALGSVGDIPLEVFLSHQIAGDNSEEEARNSEDKKEKVDARTQVCVRIAKSLGFTIPWLKRAW
jgi:S-adenosylmethionine synthetase